MCRAKIFSGFVNIETSEYVKVRAGSTLSNEGGVIIDVLDIHSHPLYESNTHDYDFAIVHLAETSEFPGNADFIKLPDSNDEPVEGEMTLVTGFGETKNSSSSLKLLRAAHIPIIDLQTCMKFYGEIGIILTDRMICAGFLQGGDLGVMMFTSECFHYRSRFMPSGQRRSNEERI